MSIFLESIPMEKKKKSFLQKKPTIVDVHKSGNGLSLNVVGFVFFFLNINSSKRISSKIKICI